MVKVKLFRDLDAAGAAGADRLNRGNCAPLFHRLDWFSLVARHTPPERMAVLQAVDGAADAWLFLALEGREAHALGNWYSLDFGAIGSGGRLCGSAALLAGLAQGLRRLRPRLARLELYPLADAGPLHAALRKAGWLVRSEPASVRWAMSTQGMSFDAYWAARPGRLRNTAERKARAAKLDLRIHGRFDAAAWSDYETVYAASWKPEEGSPQFLRALAEQEGAAGTLRLGVAYQGGRPLAAQLWLTEGGIATIHKLAYVAEARSLSPGTVLSMAMFRHALDVDQVASIDFGLGDDGYKQDWIDRSTPVHRLIAYDPLSLWGAAAAAAKLVERLRRR